MSVLGIDIGEKRIGLALGTVLAEEYDTLTVKSPAKSFFDDEAGTQQALDEIVNIVKKERIEQIAFGIPMQADDSESPLAKKIRNFTKRLEGLTDIPIKPVNETLTSFAAEEMLRDEGATIDEAKGRVDQVAAKLILQQFLEDEI